MASFDGQAGDFSTENIEKKFLLKSKKYSLHSYQKEAFYHFLRGNDCFISQPTGSGKSLIFHALPFVHFYLVVVVVLN